ncbi:MAG: fumarylacetoacetate hydrolase family protein [Polyangiaceae bacterium]|nr:fumarylacetoacetate hydrolase family protein [Polyangiaceae bacterium]
MRLATLIDGSRDGSLVVVANDGARCLPAHAVAPTLQAALDRFEEVLPGLESLARRLESESGEPLELGRCRAPLPRAYEWIDGSAYLNHVVLVRRARGAEPPETLRSDPLVYQGGSGVLLGPTDPLHLSDLALGLDCEAELAVILGDTPVGTRASEASRYVRLLTLCNDVTLRNLVPAELAKGFGFFQSKPATAFAPFAVTPDELGLSWSDGRAHLVVESTVNAQRLGETESGPEMHFSFFDLVEHVCRTRSLTAGTILGSGTISNADPSRGVSCIAERRVRELLEEGEARTPFLGPGDTVRIEARDSSGRSVFGAIEQRVTG